MNLPDHPIESSDNSVWSSASSTYPAPTDKVSCDLADSIDLGSGERFEPVTTMPESEPPPARAAGYASRAPPYGCPPSLLEDSKPS